MDERATWAKAWARFLVVLSRNTAVERERGQRWGADAPSREGFGALAESSSRDGWHGEYFPDNRRSANGRRGRRPGHARRMCSPTDWPSQVSRGLSRRLREATDEFSAFPHGVAAAVLRRFRIGLQVVACGAFPAGSPSESGAGPPHYKTLRRGLAWLNWRGGWLFATGLISTRNQEAGFMGEGFFGSRRWRGRFIRPQARLVRPGRNGGGGLPGGPGRSWSARGGAESAEEGPVPIG
jgi:hypothetical protein